MADYDFRTLSPSDFEALVRDLLSARWGTHLELFTRGPDLGIDVRRLSTRGKRQEVVQCKHYVQSGFDSLLRAMRLELPKIGTLKPFRYYLATSVALTPMQKSRLEQLLRPHVKSPADIWGQNELNAWLREFPAVQRAHFKLWLTSAAVLEAVLHSHIYGRSDELLDNIRSKAAIYVQNDNFLKARAILERLRVCIISGHPGIGKTTLAEMLLVTYISRGYQVVVVSEDIAEGERLFLPQSRQIFYYDDFLGQASTAEKLGKNEDSRLLAFMQRVARDPTKRFLLTTREHVLQEARLLYERLFYSDIELFKHTLELQSYSRLERAKILYNHLYFSSLPREATMQVVESRKYTRLVDHQNYSPRLIEHIVKLFPRSGESDLFSFALRTLNHPGRLWQHIFDNQLGPFSRSVLVVLASFPTHCFVGSLRQAVLVFWESVGGYSGPETWERSIKLLEGTFVQTRVWAGGASIGFGNPSVRDFLVNYLVEHPHEVVQLLETATYFDQVQYLAGGLGADGLGSYDNLHRSRVSIDPGDFRPVFAAALEGESRAVIEAYERTFNSPRARVSDSRVTDSPGIPQVTTGELEERATFLIEKFGVQLDLHWLVSAFASLAEQWSVSLHPKWQILHLFWVAAKLPPRLLEPLRASMAVAAAGCLMDLENPYDYFAVHEIASAVPGLVSARQLADVDQSFQQCADGLLDELDSYEPGELIEVLEDLDSALQHIPLIEDERLKMARQRAAEHEDEGDYREDSYDEYYGRDHALGSTDADVDAMFDTLGDS